MKIERGVKINKMRERKRERHFTARTREERIAGSKIRVKKREKGRGSEN